MPFAFPVNLVLKRRCCEMIQKSRLSESPDDIKVGEQTEAQLSAGAQISTQSMHLVRKGPKPREALAGVEALCCVSDSIILAAGSEGRIIALDLRPGCVCSPSICPLLDQKHACQWLLPCAGRQTRGPE